VFPGETMVRPSRFSGVALGNLGREQVMLNGAPTLLDRSLDYVETALVRGVEYGAAVQGAGKPVPTRVNEWTPARVAAWIEETLGVQDCCVRIVQQRISGRKLRKLTPDDLLNVFGDDYTRERVAAGARAFAALSSRGGWLLALPLLFATLTRRITFLLFAPHSQHPEGQEAP